MRLPESAPYSVALCLHWGVLLLHWQSPLNAGSTLITVQPKHLRAWFSSHWVLCAFTYLFPSLYLPPPAHLLQGLVLPKQRLEWPKNSQV